jgi:hypothetical protein
MPLELNHSTNKGDALMPELKILTVKETTYFKQSTKQSTELLKLPENQKQKALYKAVKDQKYSYSTIDKDDKKNEGHWKVTFDPDINGVKAWYVNPNEVTT